MTSLHNTLACILLKPNNLNATPRGDKNNTAQQVKKVERARTSCELLQLEVEVKFEFRLGLKSEQWDPSLPSPPQLS